MTSNNFWGSAPDFLSEFTPIAFSSIEDIHKTVEPSSSGRGMGAKCSVHPWTQGLPKAVQYTWVFRGCYSKLVPVLDRLPAAIPL